MHPLPKEAVLAQGGTASISTHDRRLARGLAALTLCHSSRGSFCRVLSLLQCNRSWEKGGFQERFWAMGAPSPAPLSTPPSHLAMGHCPVTICPSKPSQPFLLLLWCRRLGARHSHVFAVPAGNPASLECSSPSSASPAIISKRFETCVSESLVHSGVPH